MLKFLTSLSFLYVFAIGALLLYGFIYHRNFKRSVYKPRLFPLIFFLVCMACFSFLWVNIHAPLSLKTFSNLDHHFIQHDGFAVTKKIELGRSDTVNYEDNSFNSFLFARKGGLVTVNSSYSEDPFYVSGENGYRILSVNYPAISHTLSFQCDKIYATISVSEDDWFELKIGDDIFRKQLLVKKGISGWSLFRDEDSFINSGYYNNEKLVNSLRNILLLRDNVSRKNVGELKYFLSGRLFSYA
ncbi:MAG: hypothetical protein ACXWC7_15600, partial [Chitinophagaceae bacterium]